MVSIKTETEPQYSLTLIKDEVRAIKFALGKMSEADYNKSFGVEGAAFAAKGGAIYYLLYSFLEDLGIE